MEHKIPRAKDKKSRRASMQILTGVLVRLAVSHARNREFWPGVRRQQGRTALALDRQYIIELLTANIQ